MGPKRIGALQGRKCSCVGVPRLRASVIARWTAHGVPGEAAFEDMIRFNEAVDQAMAESARFFQDEVERAHDTLLGALAHEMRSPLATIVSTSHFLKLGAFGAAVVDSAERLLRSSHRMQMLLSDLADFTRVRLGVPFKLARESVRLDRLLSDEVTSWRMTTGARLELNVEGELAGHWDPGRLLQILSNLISNAVRYGARDEPVVVTARSRGDRVFVTVNNQGAPIPAALLESIFEPMRRGRAEEPNSGATGLGLGLFVARELARKHGGDLTVRSSAELTTFTLSLPQDGA